MLPTGEPIDTRCAQTEQRTRDTPFVSPGCIHPDTEFGCSLAATKLQSLHRVTPKINENPQRSIEVFSSWIDGEASQDTGNVAEVRRSAGAEPEVRSN